METGRSVVEGIIAGLGERLASIQMPQSCIATNLHEKKTAKGFSTSYARVEVLELREKGRGSVERLGTCPHVELLAKHVKGNRRWE